MSNTHASLAPSHSIKCVVWDLDNTLWDGVLLEDEKVTLRPDVVTIIKRLDERGILHSIASRNEYAAAMNKVKEFGLADYFIHPQINWGAKAASISAVAEAINIGLDTVAFIDDQRFELDEVAFSLPQVLCIDARDTRKLLDMPEMHPRFITRDSSQRRLLYLQDINRNQAEEEFAGPKEEFLAGLNLVFTIAPACDDDLERVEELTIRTNQLNSTGRTYSYEQLREFLESDKYRLLVAGLDDVYGTYGKIGLALIRCDEEVWTIKLLLMSCRVMSRGVGTIMLSHILQLAKRAEVRLRAEFVRTDRNRAMFVTYKFASFKEVERQGDLLIFENDLAQVQPFPNYVTVRET
ncbi:MAG TPA: HAD-IIIC family phosphatase [Anaerolineales bacterium]|nr:HAD-IIIC family phosphatase [Anaerolineales bacterium]